MVEHGHVGFALLFEHAAGRSTPRVEEHLLACDTCAAEAARAQLLLDAGRRAADAPRPSRRLLRRATRIFREHGKVEDRPSLLRLVLDTMLHPAPALRSATGEPTRFLRFQGNLTLEMQVRPVRRGVELRGQITPADAAREVILVREDRRRRKAVIAADGTFVLRSVPRGEVELELGEARIAGMIL